MTQRSQLKRRVIYLVSLDPIQSNKRDKFESPQRSLVKRRDIYKVGLDPFQNQMNPAKKDNIQGRLYHRNSQTRKIRRRRSTNSH